MDNDGNYVNDLRCYGQTVDKLFENNSYNNYNGLTNEQKKTKEEYRYTNKITTKQYDIPFEVVIKRKRVTQTRYFVGYRFPIVTKKQNELQKVSNEQVFESSESDDD